MPYLTEGARGNMIFIRKNICRVSIAGENMKKYAALVLCALVLACTATGPQLTLDNLATSMEKNNTQQFLAQFDMAQYANNYIKNFGSGDQALSSLNTLGNAIGKMLGVGNLDELIGSVVDMKAYLAEQFNRGVATGELMAQCRTAIKPDCPWVPEALRKAQVIQINNNSAIAKITTPAKITSWLAFKQIDKKWMIVGQAALEGDARAMAQAGPKPATAPSKEGATRL